MFLKKRSDCKSLDILKSGTLGLITYLTVAILFILLAIPAYGFFSVYNIDYINANGGEKDVDVPINNDYAVRRVECKGVEDADKTENAGNVRVGECEFPLDMRACGLEGVYNYYLDNEYNWPGESSTYHPVEEFGYDIRYDRDGWACDCAGFNWSEEADFGAGECCGDDPGLYLNEWNVILTLDEVDIPTEVQTPDYVKIESEYDQQIGGNDGDIINEWAVLKVPTEQWVEYSFRMEGCYLIDTEIYVEVIDESTGEPIEFSDPGYTDSGNQHQYIYHRNETNTCNGYDTVNGGFYAYPDTEYTLHFYKGMTDTALYPNVVGFGYKKATFTVSYTAVEDATTTAPRVFYEKVVDTGTDGPIELTIKVKSEAGGEINPFNGYDIFTVPESYITVNENPNIRTITSNGEYDVILSIQTSVPESDPDHNDCGLVQGGSMCFDSPKHGTNPDVVDWGWLKAEYTPGKIYDISCLGMPAVSDGTNFVVCRDPRLEIPDESLPSMKCSESDGYNYESDDKQYCYWVSYSDLDCGGAGQPECGVPPGPDSCNPYGTVDETKYVECLQSDCLVLEDCGFGENPSCSVAPDGTSCDGTKVCYNGKCRDMSCLGDYIGGDAICADYTYIETYDYYTQITETTCYVTSRCSGSLITKATEDGCCNGYCYTTDSCDPYSDYYY